MNKVGELIANLLEENLFSRVSVLDARFLREANDICFVQKEFDLLKNSLKECEILADNAFNTIEDESCRFNTESKMQTESKISVDQRNNTEPSSHRSSTKGFLRDKSSFKEKAARDKSAGRSLRTIEDKNDKSEKSMTKHKTTLNVKNGEDKGLTKNKSTLMLKENGTSRKEEPKTPKAEKKSVANLTPDKSKSRKSVTRTPIKTTSEKSATLSTLKNNDKDKTAERLREKSTERNLDKNPDKSKTLGKEMTKVNTKGNLTKENKDNKVKNGNSNSDEKKDKNVENKDVKKTHPKRENNTSISVGANSKILEEVIKKEETTPKVEVEEKPVPTIAPKVSKLDYNEILDDRWRSFSKYFNRFDNVKIIKINKVFGKLGITTIISDMQKEIFELEAKLKQLKEKNTTEDLTKEQLPFALTRGALKAVELLNETLYLKIFTEGPFPQDDIILTYRIFFQLLNLKEYTCVKDKMEFWKVTCEYFIKENNSKLGTKIQNLVKNIDFSSQNVYRLIKLLGNNLPKITPNYFSKLCGTTGLFIFLIKDALEYAGIVVDKKTSPCRLFNNYTFIIESLQIKKERLKSIQSKLFN